MFHIGQQLYAAKLVDLPSIIESHKTLDNKQIFKIADISQMLLVERPISSEAEAMQSAGSSRDAPDAKAFNIDDFIYPHGITPPMRWARKRRFRKRFHNRTIETVEREVEKLLNDDRRAQSVEYEYVDPATADAIEREIAEEQTAPPAHASDDEASERPTPAGGAPSDEEADGEEEGDEDEGEEPREPRAPRGDGDEDYNVDQDLAAELDAALAEEHSEGEEDEEEEEEDEDGDTLARSGDLEDLWDDDEEEEADAEAEADADKPEEDQEDDRDEEDGEEEAERRVRESQLEAECREIDALVRRKQQDVESTMNTLLKGRHQQALRKLSVEHDLKKKQLADLRQLRRDIREERALERAEAEKGRAEAEKGRAEAEGKSRAEGAGAAPPAGAEKQQGNGANGASRGSQPPAQAAEQAAPAPASPPAPADPGDEPVAE